MNEATYRAAEANFWSDYDAEPKEHFVELPNVGTTVRIQEIGTGEPVILLHGSPTSGTVFAPLAGNLQDFRCLIPDLPPGGLSAPFSPTRDGATTLLDDTVTDVLDAMGLDDAHLVGSSSGSTFALKAKASAPGRIGRTVHLGTPWLIEGAPVPATEKLMLLPGVSRLIGALTPGAKAQVSMMKSIGHGPSIDSGTFVDGYWDWSASLFSDTTTFRDQMAMLPAFKGKGLTYEARLHVRTEDLAVQGPTLILWGEHETFGSVEDARALAARIPGARLEIVEGAGHLPWLDSPANVAESIRTFLHGAE